MRVACICNMNNNFFALVRFLRDRGINAELIVLNYEPKHFHPSFDAFDDGYVAYTRYVKWGDIWSFATRSSDDILHDLENFDFLIGCGSVPAFVERIGIHLDALYPYGSEWGLIKLRSHLNQLPNFGHWTWYVRNVWRFSRAQRSGLRNARYVFSKDKLVHDKFRLRGQFMGCWLPMIYTPIFNPDNVDDIMAGIEREPHLRTHLAVMRAVRDRHYPIVFHHVRHVWKNCSDGISWKGNDVLIRGFADFVKRNPSLNPCLVTCEYGVDMDETKKLIASLGIENHVMWLPLLPRKAIMGCLALTDVTGAEFHFSWCAGGVLFESLAMGKPVIEYRDDSQHAGWFPELYPNMPAKTWQQVSDALQGFIDDPDHHKEIGARGRRWHDRYITEDGLRALLKAISDAA